MQVTACEVGVSTRLALVDAANLHNDAGLAGQIILCDMSCQLPPGLIAVRLGWRVINKLHEAKQRRAA